jgi:hypothetical protein
MEVAHALDVLADESEHALALVAANDRRDVWTGGTATAFRDELGDAQRAVADSAQRLRQTAGRLRTRTCLADEASAPG